MNKGEMQPTKEAEIQAGIRKRLTQLVIQTLFLAAVLFISAGRLDWVAAWVYLALFVFGLPVNGYLLYRRSPELIAERAEVKEGTKDWDRVLSIIYGLLAGVGLQLVAGLNARFGWAPQVPITLQILALVPLLAGFALSSWAMITNTFFAPTVRIQDERGHTVVSEGPYGWVRHPGYVGWSLSLVATPLLLGSFWALVSGILAVILLVVRTVFEDRTLRQELDGYAEYARRVRFRLLPGIW
jgi:protein-S-isoprenylcysteine O-methyltransferase Ste14